MNIAEIIYLPFDKNWDSTVKGELRELARARYGAKWEKKLQVRVNGDTTDGAASVRGTHSLRAAGVGALRGNELRVIPCSGQTGTRVNGGRHKRTRS